MAEDDLRVVVAMCWLGPQSAGTPPASMRTDLLDILRQFVSDERERLERVMEFAIPYGCGKWREVQSGYGGWEQRWQGAVRGLVRALEPPVAQANRWLAEHVVGFPQDREIPPGAGFSEDTAVWSDAWMLATRLARPEHLLHIEEGERLAVICMWDGTASDGTELTTSAQQYRQTIPPGAKAVWTVTESRGAFSSPSWQSFALTTGTQVLILARDLDTLVKATRNDLTWQVQLKGEEAAHVKGPATLALWECACGTTHCRERHRLDAWEPVQMRQKTVREGGQPRTEKAPLTLWDFVASAVKGPQMSIKTGSFVQGLYFPLLVQEGVTT
jgi:hypothetical protein